MNELRDEVRRLAWALPPSFVEGLAELDAEMRIYEIKAYCGVSLPVAFKVHKLLCGGES
jgi:hypothetical protein